MTGHWSANVITGFKVGDEVWPKASSSMTLQYAPQVVVGMASHPVYGAWLWLDAGDGNGWLGSHAAVNWTTERPADEELAKRAIQREKRYLENEEALADPDAPRRLRYPVM